MTQSNSDPYAVLGIPRDASQQTALEAYRRLAKQFHRHLDARDAALSALATLPSAERLALTLRYINGYSIREIAGLIGRSEAATESLLTRARDRVRLLALSRVPVRRSRIHVRIAGSRGAQCVARTGLRVDPEADDAPCRAGDVSGTRERQIGPSTG